MTAKQFSALLVELNACSEAQKWAKGKSLAVVWKTCKRGDWLLWLCGKMADKPNWPTHKEVVLAACDCAELARKHVPEGEDRPRKCIETTRAWAAGTATLDEVRTARRAVYAVYADADPADAAYVAYAAAAYAAYADAADAADAAATYAAAARTKTLATCAVLVRKRLKIARISKSRGTK
jgi:immunity protein 5 of polymorphic toxin system